MEFGKIESAGLPFVVSQEGEGPDAVLVHGFPDTPDSFAGLQRELVNAGWRVTVPWLRGYHPETIVPGRPYDAETVGRDGLALLDAIGAQRALFVGHDWGVLMCYAAAALAPERLRGIVAIAIPHPSQLQPTLASLYSARHFLALKLPWAQASTRRHDFAYLDKLYTRWSPNWSGPERDRSLADVKQAFSKPGTLRGAIDYYRALSLRGSPLLEHPPDVPNLAVAGTADLAPIELYDNVPELFPPPSRTLIVQDAGHWVHREDEDTVNAEIVRFAGEL
ncbi:MAG TPA: alpha/beta hydrolase [Solirubrobacteraceae bacterium]|nr:alpha/beta hydrolase [Solirubrobacteraceae bacterium]